MAPRWCYLEDLEKIIADEDERVALGDYGYRVFCAGQICLLLS